MTTAMTLNGLDVVSVKLNTPYRGVWMADVDFDLAAVPIAPKGPALLTIGTKTLIGVIDPNASGNLGAKGKARVLGGAGGWHKEVPAQHFSSPAGVLSTAILNATAVAVGERVIEAVPSVLGIHYTRTKGAASRVLSGLDWYVDQTTGATIVGPRVPRPANPLTVEILNWSPLEQRASIATDDIVSPGTLLTDVRFGTAFIRDVEQTFDKDGARTEAWCGKATDSGARLLSLLTSIAKETARAEYGHHHTYRVVIQSGGGYALQTTKLLGSLPDMIPIELCMGVPGFTAKLAPGSQVLVVFADGDPSKPVITNFLSGGSPPLEVTNSALKVSFGLGTKPVANATDLIAAVNALQSQATAFAQAWAALGALVGPVAGSMIAPIAVGVAASSSAGSSAVNAALATVASTRVWTD